MMEKLQAMQQKTEEVKKRLDTIIVTGESPNNQVVIEINGNRVVKNISYNVDIHTIDKEELEDLTILAMNKAIENANNVWETEMRSVAAGMIPGM